MRAKVEKIHALARRAAETPRERILREITETEAGATAGLVDADKPLPEPKRLTVAKAAVVAALAAVTKAEEDRKSVDAAYTRVLKEIADAPRWSNTADLEAKQSRLGVRLFDLWESVETCRDGHKQAIVTREQADMAFSGAQADRHFETACYRQQVDLVATVRNMLATAPMLAKHGTPTLLMLALAPDHPDLRGLLSIWGIPIERPPKPML